MTDNKDTQITNLAPANISWYSNGQYKYGVDKVDTKMEGRYNLTYKYTDKAGNVSEEIHRIVNVVK